jgi:hypothetical protein
MLDAVEISYRKRCIDITERRTVAVDISAEKQKIFFANWTHNILGLIEMEQPIVTVRLRIDFGIWFEDGPKISKSYQPIRNEVFAVV